MDLLVRGELLSARLGLARGDLSTAGLSLQQLEALIEQEGLVNHAPGMIALHVQWWLAQGNLTGRFKSSPMTTARVVMGRRGGCRCFSPRVDF